MTRLEAETSILSIFLAVARDMVLLEMEDMKMHNFTNGTLMITPKLLSERSPAPLRYATKKVRMISELLIMVQDSIYHQPGLTAILQYCDSRLSPEDLRRTLTMALSYNHRPQAIC
jgi:hypothetical protein